ncbi:cysteine protease StiP domain-containing protein [Erythrobacter oryzae]|uniref:cysteine protease StiP domain-containing protein n=1 Tax=Erythrobacter oryzae TaxID=3019556 RepID=UPI0025530EAE|nr:cysteine protease StiP domain-containing protein [Erythrobacter sp. COR-2]
MTFHGSYAPEDVTFLLKPAQVALTDVAEKEALIQSGARHYSEMLSEERLPDARYLALYEAALGRNAGRLKVDIAALAEAISARPETAKSCTIVSLARAGTPIGVLLRRALATRGVDVAHYSVSIIRGRGIDRIALAHIAAARGTQDAVFVDGWTGKGAITQELEASLADGSTGFAPFLAVVADPAGCASLAATSEDYLIPSGILGAIASGLISRSVLSEALVGEGDFHACRHLTEHAPHDRTRAFIAAIEAAAPQTGHPGWSPQAAAASRAASRTLVESLMAERAVNNVNRIKPGIAEATRAVLRRLPEAVFVRDRGDAEVAHLLHLAAQSRVPVEQRELGNYRAVTLIAKAGDAE